MIFQTLGDCLAPTLPAIIGVGMIKLALLLLSPTVLNILNETSDTYIVLSFVCNAAYYFLPVFIAVSAGEVFKTNKYIAGLLGAMLLAPEYVGYVNTGKALTIFSLPITLTGYNSQMISPILIVWLFSIIYNYLDSKVSDRFKTIIVPAISITIMVPIAFCLVGPLGVWLGSLLTKLIYTLYKMGPLGGAIYCALMPIICIAGLGSVDFTITLALITPGPDPICFFNNLCYNVMLGVTVFVYYLKKKDNEALASSITASIAGISEPALFGTVVKNLYLLIPLCTSCFVVGFLNSSFGIKSYVMASQGIIGSISTLGGDVSFIYSIIDLTIGIILSAFLSIITLKKVHE